MPIFPAATLTRLAQSLFEAAGVPAEDATVVARSLVDANLCGHDSHGVMRVPQYVEFIRTGTYKSGVPLTVLSETPAAVAADGNWGLGQVQAHRLLERVMPKAAGLGVAAGTLRNCGHTGRLGEYAEAAASENMAFFGAVNSHGAGRRVVPPGGTEGRISTNPICIGAPTSGEPVVLDFGTSAVAEGKVRVAFQKKELTPDGWLIDSTGKPTSDPAVLYAEPRGSILPFGGPQMYKGFGLGLLLDLLCGGLSGGPCSSPAFPIAGQGNTLLFVVFNPALFGGVGHFLHQADGLIEYVRSCPPADGVSAITLPGDPERAAKQKRQAEGIAIPDGTWELIAKTAVGLNVALPA
ncbi:MAG: ybiC [Gemmataceae bacterium]|nr:ybiC [Gemmataceae bacterium]